MKKIAFVIADITFVGGIERVNTILANKFISEGYSVEIISLYKTNLKINYELDNHIKISFVNDGSYLGEPGSFGRLKKHIGSQFKLFKAIKKSNADFYIINTFPMAFLSFFSLFSKKKYVVIEHVHYDYYSAIVRALRNLLYRFFYKVICINKNDLYKFSKHLDNVVKISNPLSFSCSKVADLSAKKIMAVGRLEHQKGFDLLIDIFAKVNKSNPGWELHIYGVGTCEKFLTDKINKHGLNNVKLMGSVDHIQQYYPKYSIFAFSSRFEGFGMVLLEAMECGLPCISFDCPTGPSEILGDGEYGILVENGNLIKFSAELANLMSDEEKKIKFSILSKSRAQEFNIDKIFD
ncbi:glycosyltransferase family 4 protein, partial [Escherichia coli]|nr:glycosyltransferase family 4 protein [Escherichia coli]